VGVAGAVCLSDLDICQGVEAVFGIVTASADCERFSNLSDQLADAS
jgi:hypothetical protein